LTAVAVAETETALLPLKKLQKFCSRNYADNAAETTLIIAVVDIGLRLDV